MPNIRLLMVDDHALFREALRALLASETDIEVVGEASNAGDAVTEAACLTPDIVLLDVGMPGLSSFEAVRQIRKGTGEPKVILLTMYDDEDYLVEAMDAGAGGYVLKSSSGSELVAAIREVHRGGTYLSPRMLVHLVNDFRSRVRGGEAGSPKLRSGTLTAREKEILKLLAEGGSVKEIAAMLNLSVKTVEAHKFNLMRKLDIHNKAQLVQYAFQRKIIRLQIAS